MDGSFESVPMVGEPVNIYHVQEDKSTNGWILLSFLLTMVIILLIILWVFSILDRNNIPPCSCFGPFGVEINVDANPINLCGTDRIAPCIFAKNSLADCVNECNVLQGICQAFTFNAVTSTMKIVQPINTFTSVQTNLFVRQSGTVS